MRLGTFVFPTVDDPKRDGEVIENALDEALASERLGMDAVWLAEHHFDGMCAYVDPAVFAAALATATRRVKIGFAVVQASLHHPLRLAEQISLLDHLTKGRLIAGLGKGSMYNAYEYEAFEIDPDEAAARFDEIEEIILACWRGERVVHRGKYWNFEIPMLRPRPFSKPHPALLRAVGSEASTIRHAASGRPFLFAGPEAIVVKRVELIRATMRRAGRDEAYIASVLGQSWAWQNVVVAPTDREAHEIGMNAVRDYIAYRDALELKSTLADLMRAAIAGGGPPGGYLFGSPATVAEKLSGFARAGLGGLILRFDIGPMPASISRACLEMFAREVAPALRSQSPARAAE
jgi:alkanesulfonate monooxygenase SsuD/methylene tetrahydromethanopterin reductase-like flavin-dependent oxidoreductase (luciferase family)